VSDLLILVQILATVEAGLIAGYGFRLMCPPRRRRDRRRRQAT